MFRLKTALNAFVHLSLASFYSINSQYAGVHDTFHKLSPQAMYFLKQFDAKTIKMIESLDEAFTDLMIIFANIALALLIVYTSLNIDKMIVHIQKPTYS